MTAISLEKIHGWIVLDKTAGVSSAALVAAVKRILRGQKVGHGGTLDPLATGVLPIALNEATKTADYVMNDKKTYVFRAIWGQERTTDDAAGDVIQTSSKRPTLDEIQKILPLFLGTIDQMPPLYSALKVGGRKSCDEARQGRVVPLASRNVHVASLTPLHHDECGLFTDFELNCGKGTYVRSIVRDMGRILTCYGYAGSIDRRAVGPFRKENALTLETLAKGDGFVVIRDNALCIQKVLDDIPAFCLTANQVHDMRCGRSVLGPVGVNIPDETPILCLDPDQGAVCIAHISMGRLYPRRVFNI